MPRLCASPPPSGGVAGGGSESTRTTVGSLEASSGDAASAAGGRPSNQIARINAVAWKIAEMVNAESRRVLIFVSHRTPERGGPEGPRHVQSGASSTALKWHRELVLGEQVRVDVIEPRSIVGRAIDARRAIEIRVQQRRDVHHGAPVMRADARIRQPPAHRVG